jgi:hypothetical protein
MGTDVSLYFLYGPPNMIIWAIFLGAAFKTINFFCYIIWRVYQDTLEQTNEASVCSKAIYTTMHLSGVLAFPFSMCQPIFLVICRMSLKKFTSVYWLVLG